MSNNPNDDVIECVSIRGVVINLSDVSHDLRRQYHAASAAVGRSDKAKARLNDVGEAILAEQMPHLAIKHATSARGTRGVIEHLQKRSR
jgi:hypothetical protein